jgi:hypothetical protein
MELTRQAGNIVQESSFVIPIANRVITYTHVAGMEGLEYRASSDVLLGSVTLP